MGESQKIIDLQKKINHDDFRRQEAEIKANKNKPDAYVPKHRKKRFNLFGVIFMLFLVYVGTTAYNQMQMISELDSQIAVKTKERDAAVKMAGELKADVDKLGNQETKLEIYEKVARDEYKMVRPNETIYIDKNITSNKFIKGIGSGTDETDDDEQ